MATALFTAARFAEVLPEAIYFGCIEFEGQPIADHTTEGNVCTIELENGQRFTLTVKDITHKKEKKSDGGS